MRRPWVRVRRYVGHDLWAADTVRLGPVRRAGTYLLRLIIVTARASQDGDLNLRAMGLVYSTLLSLVPLLAVTFSVLKAFGAQYGIEPMLVRLLEPLGPPGIEIAGQIVRFVSNTQVGVLGALGVAGLLYTVLALMEKIEAALNAVWHARRPRGLARKFSDYLSILLAGPVLVVAALTLIATAHSHWMVQRVLAVTRLDWLVTVLTGHVLPFVLLCTAFTLGYRLLPNTAVRLRSAFVGGAVAAVLWQLAGTAFAASLAGSAGYTAIYSGFAGVMIFLIWLYVGWLVVLIGAVVGYYDQYPGSYLATRARHGLLHGEWIALALMAEVTRRFLTRQPPGTLGDIATATAAPLTEMQPVIDDLVRRGVLVRSTEPDGLALARSPDDITVVDVLHIARDPSGRDEAIIAAHADAAADVLRRRDAAVADVLGALTLRTLVSPEGGDDAAVTPIARYRRG